MMRQTIGNPRIDSLIDGVLDRSSLSGWTIADTAVSVFANVWGGVDIDLAGDRHGCREYAAEFSAGTPAPVIVGAIRAMTA